MIPTGKSQHSFVLKDLNLSGGRYTVNVAVFEGAQRQTVVHSRHCAHFEVWHSLGYGPKYQFQMQIGTNDVQDNGSK
jgi:hypothetical protein